jgi:hypothetical protein
MTGKQFYQCDIVFLSNYVHQSDGIKHFSEFEHFYLSELWMTSSPEYGRFLVVVDTCDGAFLIFDLACSSTTLWKKSLASRCMQRKSLSRHIFNLMWRPIRFERFSKKIRDFVKNLLLIQLSRYHDNYFQYFMFGKHNGFVNNARVSAWMYFLVYIHASTSARHCIALYHQYEHSFIHSFIQAIFNQEAYVTIMCFSVGSC